MLSMISRIITQTASRLIWGATVLYGGGNMDPSEEDEGSSSDSVSRSSGRRVLPWRS